MKITPDEDHECLHDMLEDLLDRYPAAVIVVRDRDGGAIVVHGGDANSPADTGILKEVPAIVNAYQRADRPVN